MDSLRAVTVATAIVLGARPAHAQTEPVDQGEQLKAEELTRYTAPEEQEKRPLPWHGTTFSFDQSLTTQTVGVGSSYQSYDPTYEWWFALKPRYWLHETKVESVSLSAWANLYLELTNSDTTTYRNQPVVGQTWVYATYARVLRNVDRAKTEVFGAPRLVIPDRASLRLGQIVGVGAITGASQTLPLSSESRPFSHARLAATLYYNHPFCRSSSPVNDGSAPLRQDAVGRTFASDVVSGSMMLSNELWASTEASLELVPKVELSLAYVHIASWSYAPPESSICTTTTGCVTPRRLDSATTYHAIGWLTSSVSMSWLDELSVSFGYYNQAGQLGPDGRRRNPLWSPDARIFLTLTANLDAIYERVAGGGAREASSE